MGTNRRLQILKDHPNLALQYFAIFRKNPMRSVSYTLRRMLFDLRVSTSLLEDCTLPPHALWLFPTRRCNLRCKMCWQWGSAGYFKENSGLLDDELSTDDMKRIIDQVAHFSPYIVVTGGEPFIRKDLAELVEYIKSNGLICHIQTNGTLITDETANRITNAGIDSILFSINGSNPSINDEITGVPGSLERTVEGIRRMKSFRKGILPIMMINCVITKYNYTHLYDMIDFAEKLGVDRLQFSYPNFFTEEAVEQTEKEWFEPIQKSWKRGYWHHAIDGIDIKRLQEEMDAIKNHKMHSNMDIEIRPEFTANEICKFFTQLSWAPKGGKCLAALGLEGAIEWNGNLQFCGGDYVVGNLKSQDLRDLWYGLRAEKFRKNIQKRVKEGKLFPCCTRCGRLFRARSWQIADIKR